MSPPRVRVFIGLGSNVAERFDHLQRAVRGVASLPQTLVVRTSPVYETNPVGPVQRNFLNAVVEARTGLSAEKVFQYLKSLERALGRKHRRRWGPREIDLDILFYGNRAFRDTNLEIPHPRLRTRKFVLKPLSDLAPALRDPVTHRTVSRLLADLTDPSQKIRLYSKKRLVF